jgi:hypothetical protein
MPHLFQEDADPVNNLSLVYGERLARFLLLFLRPTLALAVLFFAANGLA